MTIKTLNIVIIILFNLSFFSVANGQEKNFSLCSIFDDFKLSLDSEKAEYITDTVRSFNFNSFDFTYFNRRRLKNEGYYVLYKEKLNPDKIIAIDVHLSYNCRFDVIYSKSNIFLVGYYTEGMEKGSSFNGFFVKIGYSKKMYFIGTEYINNNNQFLKMKCIDIKSVMTLDDNLLPHNHYRFNSGKFVSAGKYDYKILYTEEIFELSNLNNDIDISKISLNLIDKQYGKCSFIGTVAVTKYLIKPYWPLWYCHPCKTIID